MSFPSKRFRSSLRVKKDLSDFHFKTSGGIDSRTSGSATASSISLSNTSTAYFSQLQLSGRTYTNRASWGGCETTDGWALVQATVSTDTDNEFEGTGCHKIVIAANETEGAIYRDVMALLDKTKYYMLSAYVKNGDSTNGIYIASNLLGDKGIVKCGEYTGTTWTRQGIGIQPSDFDGASTVTFSAYVKGSAGQFGYVDACAINEISAADFALCTSNIAPKALLDKYPFVLGTKSTAPSEITVAGTNLSVRAYTPILHSVPAIADTYDCVTGVHTVNTAYDADISGTDYGLLDNTTYANVDYIKTMYFTSAKAGTEAIDGIIRYYNSAGLELSEISAAGIDNVASIGKFYYSTSKAIFIFTAKGTYADLAAARTGLGTTSVRYQLATPTVTQETATGMSAKGTLGTITQDGIIKDGGTYSSGLTITDSTYPIVTLAEVYKTAAGVDTQITIASCTVAGDGLSFTSTELSDGDVVTYRYYRSPYYTIGQIDYAYRTTA